MKGRKEGEGGGGGGESRGKGKGSSGGFRGSKGGANAPPFGGE